MIDAILDPRVPPTTVKGRDRERYLGQVIFDRWPTTNLIISPYVLGEFVQRGRQDPYGKSLAEMRRMVRDDLLPYCRVAFFKGNLRLAEFYDQIGIETRFLVDLELEGDATDQAGRRIPKARGRFRVTRAGQILKSLSAGLPANAPTLDPETISFDSNSKVKIGAAAFELVLFDSAAQLVERTGATWKDAFHYLYAKWDSADTIVTTDKPFITRSRAKKHNLPKVEEPSSVEDFCRVLGDFHQAVFDPEQTRR